MALADVRVLIVHTRSSFRRGLGKSLDQPGFRGRALVDSRPEGVCRSTGSPLERAYTPMKTERDVVSPGFFSPRSAFGKHTISLAGAWRAAKDVSRGDDFRGGQRLRSRTIIGESGRMVA
jgi:hypothetical protein